MRIPRTEVLERRLHRLERAALITWPPRQWNLELETGEEVPSFVLEAVSEQDTLIVREYPAGLIEESEYIGMATWSGGIMFVYRDHIGEPRQRPRH